ncbi:type II toxin-antitoxin system RelE/ParE family toxin [Dolichospermum sp. ST_sed1]|nr:type II toxin-antitoxin system RelE/ParE family toxin [Dolichospermum sp. ST_sed1]MDD1427498.1 type II toxin-antitoxin system RelE/ParE family toxin [Dolichospermum sp. ST_sed9]MDD1434733.1 type II toxin-antitoxin system RelE/ParE family toxin [Dolichospermum sp. ST_sed6]MDD1441644.1 type II toxin-antitoxin system RelE/ParE family toxin [Dolichospermum sp. ST_sed3]MDD1448929.1 type II toxin-antitoxin system RelE/ParE family toxin [Dolichospermum sp. ST_sed8]MDD1453786.1 type II toxin-antito
MKLEFSESAIQDLIRLREFIAVHNPKAAERISLRLRQAIAKIVLHPDIGRSVSEFENVRELVAGDYVVRYLRLEDVIFILRIWHGKEFRDFG